MSQKQINYISGLKGISCFLIMVGHFLGVIKYINVADFDYSKFMGFAESPFGIIINESFWLILFFVTSGYLLSLGSVDDLLSFVLKILKRFLRLGVPVFFSCAIIYVFLMCFGLHNNATRVLFENTWYQTAFSVPLTWRGVVMSPIDVLLLRKCIFNSPYWVLRDMFINSILVYLCLYLQKKLEKVRGLKCLIICVYMLFGLKFSYIAFSFAVGMAIAGYECIIKRILLSARGLVIMSVLILGIGYVFRPSNQIAASFWGAVIVIVPYITCVEQLLSSKALLFLGQISFGIYSFHWPVVCSVGAQLLLFFAIKIGIAGAVMILAVSSAIVTCFMAYAYMLTVEKLSAQLINRVVNSVESLLRRNVSVKKVV